MSEKVVLGSTRASKTGEGKEFDRVFLVVVDDVFCQVFGETIAETILLHLERNKGLKWEEIPRNIEEFSSNLTGLLGSSAHTLERLVIKLLCSRLQLEYDAKQRLNFADYVRELRQRFER